jgi:DNA-directed RNA polymerase subunit E'/Rpb7
MNKTNDFATRVFSTQRIFLLPSELNSSMEKTIEKKIREYEGTCNQDGYILKNSIVLVERKNGVIRNSEMTGGAVVFNIRFQMAVVAPKPKHIIPCVVKEKNSVGILAEWGYDNTFPIYITILKQYHSDLSLFDKVSINTYIQIQVLSARYQLKDTKIIVTGSFIAIIEKSEYDTHIQEMKVRLMIHDSLRKENEEGLPAPYSL